MEAMEEGNHTMMEKIYAPIDVRPIGALWRKWPLRLIQKQ